MHFGPTDAERQAGAAQAARDAAASASVGGGGGGGGGGPRLSAREAHRLNQAAFAQAGLSETQHYRAFAEHYRAARRAHERAWPATLAALSLLLGGVYVLARKLQER